MIVVVRPVVDRSLQLLCTKPYHNHPHGCPNFSFQHGCKRRPGFPLYDALYDLGKPIFAIINAFDLEAHVKKMLARHPGWTEYQLRNPLFWQGTARAQLRKQITSFLWKYARYQVETVPEAMGVNVAETVKRAGAILTWPALPIAYQVALAGQPRGGKEKDGITES